MNTIKKIITQYISELSNDDIHHENRWKENHSNKTYEKNISSDLKRFDREMNRSIKMNMCKSGRYEEFGFHKDEEVYGRTWHENY